MSLPAEVPIPDCWAQDTIEQNTLRQLLVPADVARLTRDNEGVLWATTNAGCWPALTATQKYSGWDLSLRLPGSRAQEQAPQWLGGRTTHAPESVRESFLDTFQFLEEDPACQRPGLRRPQLGALHAALAYWTTGKTDPATVVMPTGTGKTETMVALTVAARLERLLVIVPSDALRTQISGKFERLGVLQSFGVVRSDATRPVVGQIHHSFKTVEGAREFASRCNVIVTTPQALNAAAVEVRRELLGVCSHMFVDEAHHIAARTWLQLRDEFAPKPIIQFTATPFREDAKPLGGRQVYSFPLREAQRDGYFASINYVSILDFVEPDRAIADRAISQLREDLADGKDHVLMARVSRKGRADDLLTMYRELADDLGPVRLYSSLPKLERDEALDRIRSRESRIIICVDMLGEGFDLPELKVAAIHDPHKSLGVTLQFIGRFARSGADHLGHATVVVSRPDRRFDPKLRRLYAEDADWNSVVRDLSETEVETRQEVSDFEDAFGSPPEHVTLRNLEPKMSTVVYRTSCETWSPENAIDEFPPENLLTYPLPVNTRDHVMWFVTHEVTPVRWGDLRTVEEVRYHLYVLYWDPSRQLLYINSSNNDSVHQALADAVTNDSATRITGETVYRVMAHLARLVPTNVGVLDTRNRNRRFSLHVGADVNFPLAESQTKTQTNIFATGYDGGDRVTVGAALKGRIWTQRAARSIHEWMRWCDGVGSKVIDEGISIDEVMRGFIRPQIVEARPPHVALAIEWPWHLYSLVSDELLLSCGGRTWQLIDADLVVTDFSDSGPIYFEIRTPAWTARYLLRLDGNGMTFEKASTDEVLVVNRTQSATLADFLDKHGANVIFADDVMVVPPGHLLKPDRDIPPFNPAVLQALDWQGDGVDIKKESQGIDRDPASIQARTIRLLVESGLWEAIVDDDGSGEIADIVAMRVEDDHLVVQLVHCKYSSKPSPGARVDDLYELCGQAQKSARWRRDIGVLFDQLIRRESQRQKRTGVSGIEVGDPSTLYNLQERSLLLRTRLEIVLVQPGLSKAKVSKAQLELLACTEVYARETADATLSVLTSE